MVKPENELADEWISFEWLLIDDLKRGDMVKFDYRIAQLRDSLLKVGCTKGFIDEHLPIRITELKERMNQNRGVIVHASA